MDMGDYSLHKLAEMLDGSPYSIPTDSESRASVLEMLQLLHLLDKEAAGVQGKLARDLGRMLGRAMRVREIHESNLIEDAGFETLAETNRALLASPETIEQAIHHYTVLTAVKQDQRVLDVVGLHAAKLFAQDMAQLGDRPITESDIRSLHKLTMGDHYMAGRYKMFQNAISGKEHEHKTSMPLLTTMAMRDLVDWLEGVQIQEASSLLLASVAHAWLAHIHPFDDGNGRVSRLIANMILGRAALPPLIISRNLDRKQYYDSLSTSDEGGDLAPLIRLFIRIMKRGLSEMREPGFARRLFEDDLKSRALAGYETWFMAFDFWLSLLAAQLRLRGLDFEMAGTIDQRTYQWLTRPMPPGRPADQREYIAGWILIGTITDPSRENNGAKVSVIVRRPGRLARTANGLPVIRFFVERKGYWMGGDYMPWRGAAVGEILVLPGSPGQVYVYMDNLGRVKQGDPEDAADYVSGNIASDYRRAFGS
jgi:Fic family protein